MDITNRQPLELDEYILFSSPSGSNTNNKSQNKITKNMLAAIKSLRLGRKKRNPKIIDWPHHRPHVGRCLGGAAKLSLMSRYHNVLWTNATALVWTIPQYSHTSLDFYCKSECVFRLDSVYSVRRQSYGPNGRTTRTLNTCTLHLFQSYKSFSVF